MSLTAEELKALQAPLKDQYRSTPETAIVTLHAVGELDSQDIACSIDTGKALVKAGLHPATGGDGSFACSGDMLLQALVACAGVTLKAVATALAIDIKGGSVKAEGDLDFKGTLGVDKLAPVGFKSIRLTFDVQTDANEEQKASLLKLTERYCVVFQTLKNSPETTAELISG